MISAAIPMSCTMKASMANQLHGRFRLARQHGSIHGQIQLHPTQVGVVARFAQVIEREVLGATTRVELFGAQIYCVGTRLNSSMKARHAACRSKQLRSFRRHDIPFAHESGIPSGFPPGWNPAWSSSQSASRKSGTAHAATAQALNVTLRFGRRFVGILQKLDALVVLVLDFCQASFVRAVVKRRVVSCAFHLCIQVNVGAQRIA